MITAATYKDHFALLELWEISIRATQDFLTEEYLKEIREMLPGILPHVKLFAWRERDGKIKGFVGVTREKLEMLFIHPDYMGEGLGRQFTMFCVYTLNIDKVDINEQNQSALGFYRKMGYEVIKKQEVDSSGKTHSIIQMQYKYAS